MEPPKNKDSDKIIADKNFERLIESEYDEKGRPVDELAKKRIWESLNAENRNAPIKNQSLHKIKIGLVLAACLASVLGTMQYFNLVDTDPYASIRAKGVRSDVKNTGVKGHYAGIEYHIGTYIQDAGGQLTVLDDSSKKKEGDIIVPFIETSVPAAAVLVKQVGDDQYEAVSTAEATEGGSEHYFARDGEAAGILVEAVVETYCVLLTDSMPTMGNLIGELPEIKDKAKVKIECFSL